MIIEVTNKRLINLIEEAAAESFITPEAVLKQIIVEHFAQYDAPEKEAQTDTLNAVRDDAEKLGLRVSEMLSHFCNKYEVSAKLVEGDYKYVGQGSSEYFVEVKL